MMILRHILPTHARTDESIIRLLLVEHLAADYIYCKMLAKFH